jgi:uncharacterized protein
MEKFETLFYNHMAHLCAEHPDPSHDLLHVTRVVGLAKRLAEKEGAQLEVVVPAAYLHDCVYISKTDHRRKRASRISADRAVELLRSWNYPVDHLPAIHHAILAHSFSAGLPAETIEAKVVQDADRLDAIGAIGVFRCFAFSGISKRPLYSLDDPFCLERNPEDSSYTLDHFFVKLLHLEKSLHTKSACEEAEPRVSAMKTFLASLKREILMTH